jgi:hypothetical protein
MLELPANVLLATHPACSERRHYQPCRRSHERKLGDQTKDDADKEPREERSCGRSQTLLYNPKRRHSTIGYLSPMEFERQAGLTQAGVNRTGCSSRRTCASEGSQPRAARVVQSNLNLETLPARLGAGPFSGGRYRVMLKLIFLVCPTLRVLCEKASLASDLTGPRCPIVE